MTYRDLDNDLMKYSAFQTLVRYSLYPSFIPKQQHRLLIRPNRGSCKAVYSFCLILEHLTRPTASVFWGEYVVTCWPGIILHSCGIFSNCLPNVLSVLNVSQDGEIDLKLLTKVLAPEQEVREVSSGSKYSVCLALSRACKRVRPTDLWNRDQCSSSHSSHNVLQW